MTSPRLDAKLTAHSSTALSVFRIIFGLLFALHGSMKIFGWPIGTAIEVGMWPGWWAGLIELVTGVLITIGLATRPAAFLASGQMAAAYFFWHWPFNEGPKVFWPMAPTTTPPAPPDANGGEPAIMYCFAFLLILFMGPGRLAIDARRRPRTAVYGTGAPRPMAGTAVPPGSAIPPGGAPVAARRPGLMDRLRGGGGGYAAPPAAGRRPSFLDRFRSR